jgi:hypothetical protein
MARVADMTANDLTEFFGMLASMIGERTIGCPSEAVAR